VPKRKKISRTAPKRRGRGNAKRNKFMSAVIVGSKLTAAAAAVLVVSASFIFLHDLLTQCDYFGARRLKIEGMQRLTRDQIARQAGVHAGTNILAVNLSLARKRLLAHPWIADAQVSREIPSGLAIVVIEHTALAMVDFGTKYLINRRGEIFKAWEPTDPGNLPLISGLSLSDLTVHGRSGLLRNGSRRERSAPFKAVMQVLQLGDQKGSILPNRIVKQILVDRQIGLTVQAFEQGKTINLGYRDYAGKYHLLSNLLSYIKNHRGLSGFDRIDLNNMQRVVVNPIRTESRAAGS